MSQVRFETDNLPGAFFGMQLASMRLIEELAKARPDRNYIESLREQTIIALKNAVPTGIAPEDEKNYVDASVGAVNFIFDQIAWR